MNKVCHIVGGGDFFGIRSVGEGDLLSPPIRALGIFKTSA